MDLTTILVALTALSLTLLWQWLTHHARASSRAPLPPGPGPCLPVLGHFHLLRGADLRVQFRRWRRKYGEVFSLRVGQRLLVVLNGRKTLREALIQQATIFSHRPQPNVFDLVTKSKGVGDTSGRLWKTQRKVSMEILRRFGMGKNLLMTKVQEEVAHFLAEIRSKQGRPFEPTHLVQVSVSNNICSIALGKRFSYDDQRFINVLEAMEELLTIGGKASFLVFVPFLRYLPGDLFKIRRGIKLYHFIMDSFLIPFIEERVKECDGEERSEKKEKEEEEEEDMGSKKEEEKDFICAYLREARRAHEKGTADIVNDFNLQKVLFDLFTAGTDTLAASIRWSLIYFLHHPTVQEKCYQDILRVIGPSSLNRPPNMADKAEMTYVEATIREVLRVGEVVPLGIAHAPSMEVEFRGYTIPEDAFVLPNLDSVLQDPDVWDQPQEFRPERFIGEDGKLIQMDEFLPFSLGRRVCLGESLAWMELFLYLTSLVQHFRFLPPEDGQLPSLTGLIGLVHNPKPFLVRAIPRQ